MFDLNKLQKLSWLIVGISVIGVTFVIVVIISLGGWELLSYVKITLIQAVGLAMAATAGLFFVVRLVWRLKALPMLGAIGFFIVGVILFVSVSIGRFYAFQYPVFVESFGPGKGPGLPFLNVVTFFRNIDNFQKIADIARNPNDVPAPITVAETDLMEGLSPDQVTQAMLEQFGSEDILVPLASGTPIADEAVVHEIYLETTEVLAEIAPGITFNYWTYNDAVPGPFYRVKEGDIVNVTIHNRAENLHHHNVDFHAATGPGGGGAVSIVNPGETKTFSFKALNPGLFVYHCAVPNMASHMAHGMYGLILVEPKEGLPPVDKEFYVMQGELYTTGALGRQGLQIFDAKKMLDGIPEYITFNGRPGGLGEHMQAEVGDRVRIYFGNGGVSHISSFHVVGEIFDTVYPEASMGAAKLANVQTTVVPAGGATIVEFTVDYPGNYVLVDHSLARIDKGAWGILTVTGEADPAIFNGSSDTHDHSSH